MSRGEKIQKALGPHIEKSKWEVKRYSNTNDFQSLWELGNDRLDPDKNILVIWDGFPPDKDSSPVALEKFITPMDWVFAYLHKHEDLKSKIAILDIYSHECPGSIIEFHQRILEEIEIEEHILFYSFNRKDFEKACNPLDIKHIEEVIDLLSPVSQTKLADLSREMWDNLIEVATEDNSRHSINNILDPILLGEATLSPEKFNALCRNYSIHRIAFYNSLKWHGRFDQMGNNKNNDFEEYSLDKKTKIVLVDDQAKHSWEPLLEQWIGGEIDSKENADFIIKQLNALEPKGRAKLSLTQNNEENLNEILLFDLYLFPPGSSEERKYFNAVLECAKKYKSLNYLTQEYLDGLAGSLNNGREMEYLTLLPRLIAEIDPTIPIIIFSSTGYPRLDGIVNPNLNIKRFDKPLLFDRSLPQQLPTIQEQRKKFTDIIRKAAEPSQRVARIREFYSHFSKPTYGNSKPSVVNGNNKETLRVELYIDEKGTAGRSRNFSIGGIYIVGPNDDQKWEDFNNNGNIWGDFGLAWDQLRQLRKDKRQLNQKIKRTTDKTKIKGLYGELKRIYQEIENNKGVLRSKSENVIKKINEHGEFHIYAIRLKDNDQITKDNNQMTKSSICKQIRKIEQSVKKENANFIYDSKKQEITQILKEKVLFTDSAIHKIFKKIYGGQDKYDQMFNQFIKDKKDDPLVQSMVEQHRTSITCHLNLLMELIKLFFNVTLPMLEEELEKQIQCKHIGYGNVSRELYLAIAEALNEAGYMYNTNANQTNQSWTWSYLIRDDAISNNPSIREAYPGRNSINIKGFPNEEFSKSHCLADAVISDWGKTDVINNLYAHPGMQGTTGNLMHFREFNDSFYRDNYQEALDFLIGNEKSWDAVKKVIEGKNKLGLYICNTMGKKVCSEIPQESFQEDSNRKEEQFAGKPINRYQKIKDIFKRAFSLLVFFGCDRKKRGKSSEIS